MFQYLESRFDLTWTDANNELDQNIFKYILSEDQTCGYNQIIKLVHPNIASAMPLLFGKEAIRDKDKFS